MELNKSQLDIFQEKLLEIKNETEKELRGLDNGLDFGDDIDHGEEETDETEEAVNVMGAKNELKSRLMAVEKALDKIKNNAYGKCEKCGMDIEMEVLNAAPESEKCKMCKIDRN